MNLCCHFMEEGVHNVYFFPNLFVIMSGGELESDQVSLS